MTISPQFFRRKNISGFHGTFATGVACQQGTLTLPDTWFCPPFWDEGSLPEMRIWSILLIY